MLHKAEENVHVLCAPTSLCVFSVAVVYAAVTMKQLVCRLSHCHTAEAQSYKTFQMARRRHNLIKLDLSEREEEKTEDTNHLSDTQNDK